MTQRPRLLWWSDSPTDETGFARVGRSICPWLAKLWSVAYLALGYNGDPHPFPWRIYPATQGGGDPFGFSRAASIVGIEQPDVLLMNTDLYVVAQVVHDARKWKRRPKLVAYCPIDTPGGVKGGVARMLNELDLFIAYTDFGLGEMRAAGFTGDAIVVPHGFDQRLYRPHPKAAARARIVPGVPADALLIGNVNRNQPRKRLDLTVMYFAEWVRSGRAPANAALYLHCAKQDAGWDLEELARKLDVRDRVFVAVEKVDDLPDEELMPLVYSALDIQVTTTLGEGWGLPALEGMACGVPQIAPDWSALGDWARPAARLVRCTGIEALFGYHTFGFGGVVDQRGFLDALDELASDPAVRAEYARRGLELAAEERFRWDEVAGRFHLALMELVGRPVARAVQREAAVA